MPGDAANTATPRSIVEEGKGDLFEAPENAVLIHACNCVGSWGAGIAKAFKTKYPAAYRVHNEYCKATSADQLIGTCQLIPPQKDDYERAVTVRRPPSNRRKVDKSEEKNAAEDSPGSEGHWIACLFTSKGYGKPTKAHPGMDKPEVILENTKESLVDLKDQLLELQNEDEKEKEGAHDSRAEEPKSRDVPGELWSCKFNSGLFAVDWADTRKVLEEELKSLGKMVRVISPAES